MNQFICETCGAIDKPKTITKGSLATELVLWLCLLVPGMIYSVWRLSSRYQGCRECGGKMVRTNSPRGRLLIEQLHGER